MKYYVVWTGKVPGIYNFWADCQQQIHAFPQAQYKSFKSRVLAEEAFTKDFEEYKGIDYKKREFITEEQLILIGKPKEDSICVDAACSGSPGPIEYRDVDLATKTQLFNAGPFEGGTSNIGEFLAIVHALAYCKKNGIMQPIYSDSQNAIKWVQNVECSTLCEQTENNKKLFELIGRALYWLGNNKYENKILKWETKYWGETPADFGRK